MSFTVDLNDIMGCVMNHVEFYTERKGVKIGDIWVSRRNGEIAWRCRIIALLFGNIIACEAESVAGGEYGDITYEYLHRQAVLEYRDGVEIKPLIVPRDRDSVNRPFCRVRDDSGREWSRLEYTLVGVNACANGGKFIVINPDDTVGRYHFCEIVDNGVCYD